MSVAEQIDLFGEVPPTLRPIPVSSQGSKKTAVLIPFSSKEPEPEPDRKFDFAWCWAELLHLEQQHAGIASKMSGVWRETLGPETVSRHTYSSSYTRPPLKEGEWDDGIKSAMHKHLESMLEHMVYVAEREFGVPGAPLTISKADLHKEFYKYHSDVQKFDPQGAWRYLEKKYGGAEGKLLAYRQHADELAKRLSIHYQQPEWKHGMMVISDRVFHEDDFRGNWKLSYNYEREVYETLKELMVFFEWNKQAERVPQIREAQDFLCTPGYRLKSRRKLDVCPGLEIVTYKEKYEYWFDADTAQRLQVYLSTYASPNER